MYYICRAIAAVDYAVYELQKWLRENEFPFTVGLAIGIDSVMLLMMLCR